MEKKKILFISGWFPYPPNNGSRIRIYNFIKALSTRYQVFLLALLQSDSDPSEAVNLKEYCSIVSLHPVKVFNPKSIKSVLGFFSSRPRSIVDTFDPVVDKAIDKALSTVKPEIVIASTLQVVEYVIKQSATPSILIDHNCEFGVMQRNAEYEKSPIKRWRLELGWRKNARWEVNVCNKFTKVVLPSEEDKKRMLCFDPQLTNLTVIPNGSDITTYHPDRWKPNSNKLLYTGSLTYDANLDAVEYYVNDIYPILNRIRPGIKLYVTGRYDNINSEKIKKCSGVVLTGYVEEIQDELYSSGMLVVPLRKGGGMRLKIPEAMAAGVPVVSTTMGCEGIEYIDRKHLLIADTPEEFANAINNLLTNENLSQHLRLNARQLIEQKYDWQVILPKFLDLVERCMIEY